MCRRPDVGNSLKLLPICLHNSCCISSKTLTATLGSIGSLTGSYLSVSSEKIGMLYSVSTEIMTLPDDATHLWACLLGFVLLHYLQLRHCSVGFNAAAVVQACGSLICSMFMVITLWQCFGNALVVLQQGHTVRLWPGSVQSRDCGECCTSLWSDAHLCCHARHELLNIKLNIKHAATVLQ